MNKAFIDGFRAACAKYNVDPRALTKYAAEAAKKEKADPKNEVTPTYEEVETTNPNYYTQSAKERGADALSVDSQIANKAQTMTDQEYSFLRLLSELYGSYYTENPDGTIGGYSAVNREFGRRPIPPKLTPAQIKARIALAAKEGNRGLDVAPGAAYSESVLDPEVFNVSAQAYTPAGTNFMNAAAALLGYGKPDWRAVDKFTGKGQGAFGRNIPLPQGVLRAHEQRSDKANKELGVQ